MWKARIITALAGAVVMVGLMASPAAAYGYDFYRECNGEVTTYTAYVANNGAYAYTTKHGGSSASCSGSHAWVRIKVRGTWYAWKNDPTRAEITSGIGPIEAANHKGCSSCTVYLTTPSN